MGSRPCLALTESEHKKLENHLNNLSSNHKYIYNMLVYTGIRCSDWNALVEEFIKTGKHKQLNVFITKQSNRKKDGKKSNKKVLRSIVMPDFTYKAIMNNQYELKLQSESNIKRIVKEIEGIANNIGISRLISPHDFRATFINLLKHRGYDIVDVSNVTQLSYKTLAHYFAKDADIISQSYADLNNDPWDLNNPKIAIERAKKAEAEVAHLRQLLKMKEVNNA